MEIMPYFQDIRAIIINELQRAENEVIIAMAWFTNHDIFDTLLSILDKIKVKLLVINDDINNRMYGLNFQKFIDKGGLFYFGAPENPMHNKYCIIDRKVLLTGSYNYTYLAESINAENLIKISGACEAIEAYIENFEKELIYGCEPIRSIDHYLEIHPYSRNVFSYNNYGIKDIYQYYFNLQESGANGQAENVLKYLESSILLSDEKEFIIRDVIYRQWKQDYYAEKIEVHDNLIILHYTTFLTRGGWVHAPGMNDCWLLRNSDSHSEFVKTHKITNIKINGENLVPVAEEGVIYYFSPTGETEIDENTDLGYPINANKRPIKDDGEEIEIIDFIIKEGAQLSCEIHFLSSILVDKKVDLIEGLTKDKKDNHWHCFDINMKLNREKL